MSSLGFQSLYHHVASFRGVRAARFFSAKGEGGGGEELFSPESDDPRKTELFPGKRCSLKGFDAVFFSVSFELDYPAVLSMLDLSKIPLLGSERGPGTETGDKPFILVGGIAVSANPFIMSVFADAVFIGDMEESLGGILETLYAHEFRKNADLFRELAALPGVFVPGKGLRRNGGDQTGEDPLPGRAIARVITAPAHSAIITEDTEFSGMFLVEIVRGCRQACNFCMTRCVSGPVRSVGADIVVERVEKALGLSLKIGLVGPVLTDNKALVPMVERINTLGGRVSFSSLRADDFDEKLARLMKENGQTSLTFAPETGSTRLRELIGKAMAPESILKAVSIALDHGVKKFRYYLMYGLPGETREDLRLTSQLARETAGLLRRRPGASLHLSINPFVPKRGTSFERERILPKRYYEDAKRELRRQLETVHGLRLRFESIRLLPVHYVLSIGGRDVAFALKEAVQKGRLGILERFVEETSGWRAVREGGQDG